MLIVQEALVGFSLWTGGSESLGHHTHLCRIPVLLKAEWPLIQVCDPFAQSGACVASQLSSSKDRA